MINLLLGDCLERMKEIPDGSVDLILTDPPYGTTACKWDSVIPLEPMWEQLKRIIKPNGAIVLFGQEPFSSLLRCSNLKMYKYDWVWNKTTGSNFFNAKNAPVKRHECVSVFSLGTIANKSITKMKYFPQGLADVVKLRKPTTRKDDTVGVRPSRTNTYTQTKTGYPTSIIKFPNDCNGFHPTQKPVALMEYLIKTYTNENETVLDFTMGSGTTGVACKNLNRNFIGIEKDETYFKIAQDRIAAI